MMMIVDDDHCTQFVFLPLLVARARAWTWRTNGAHRDSPILSETNYGYGQLEFVVTFSYIAVSHQVEIKKDEHWQLLLLTLLSLSIRIKTINATDRVSNGIQVHMIGHNKHIRTFELYPLNHFLTFHPI